MKKNKKFAIVITEEKNGRNETSIIYADSVNDAMNYISLIKNKKASVKIMDADENLIYLDKLNSKEGKKDKDNDKKDKDKKDKDKKDKDKKDKDKDHGNGHLYNHGNGHWSHEEPHDDDDDDHNDDDDDDDDYMYA